MRGLARYVMLLMSVLAWLSIRPGSLWAQYMYLDSNGDGVNTAEDVLNPNGIPTPVDVYIFTDMNADLSSAFCNTNDGDLTINSYVVNLEISSGTAIFTGFVNRRPEMATIIVREMGDSLVTTEWQRGQGGGAINPPTSWEGIPYRLMSVTVTGDSGAPALAITAQPSSPGYSAQRTSFGTACTGVAGNNTYSLGLDWLDVSGINGAPMPPSITAPSGFDAEEGASVTLEATATSMSQVGTPSIVVQGYPPSLTLQVIEDGPTVSRAVLSGELGASDSGTYTILWTASQGSSPSATDTTVMNVVSMNFPPEIYVPNQVTGREGTEIVVVVEVEDPDGDTINTLTVNRSQLPAGNDATFTTTIDKTHGTFQWTPSFVNAGSYNIKFTATNYHTTTAGTNVIVTECGSPCAEWPVRVQLPHPGARLDAYYFAAACSPGGALCVKRTFHPDANGFAYVPLKQCDGNGTNCVWWDRVVLEALKTGAAAEIGNWVGGGVGPDEWAVELYQTIELNPADVAADRITEYAIAGDPWEMATLDAFSEAWSYFGNTLSTPGGPPTNIGQPVHLVLSGTVMGYRNDDGVNHDTNIYWPDTAQYFASRSPLPMEWVAAHEYVHVLQEQAGSYRGAVCQGQQGWESCRDDRFYREGGNEDNIEEYYELFCHTCNRDWNANRCAESWSRRFAWSEGVADGLAEVFYKARVNAAGSGYMAQPCAPGSASRVGSVGGFVAAVAGRTPREFWHRLHSVLWTMGYGNPSEAQLKQYYNANAQTADQFLDLWYSRIPSVPYIDQLTDYAAIAGTYEPGSWDINGIYGLWILTSGVTGVVSEGQVGGRMLLNVHPNPAAGTVAVRLHGGESQAAVEVQVFDVQGRAVRRLRMANSGVAVYSANVNLNGLASGLYFVRAVAAGKELAPVRRLVVMR